MSENKLDKYMRHVHIIANDFGLSFQEASLRHEEEALRKQAKEIFKKKVSIYICHICGKFLGKNAWCSKCDASSGTEVFEGIPAKVLKKEMGVL